MDQMIMLRNYVLGIFALLLTHSVLNGTEFKPWFSPEKLFEIRPKYTYQNYQRVKTGHGTKSHHSSDQYASVSTEFSYEPEWEAELEFTAGRTSQHEFGMNDERLTGRYIWLDDVVGDPVSLTTGVTIVNVHRPALNDISNFYHGPVEFEAHVAVGKEEICREFWTSRYWGVLGAGIANKHSPWIRADINWEYNYWDLHQFRVFANTLWGLGSESLSLDIPFHGYGPIQHQSIDLGIRYNYFMIDSGNTINIEYKHRVYARNAPEGVNVFMALLMIPFNL